MSNITPLPPQPRKPKTLGYYMGAAIGFFVLLTVILGALLIIKYMIVLLLR